MDKNSQACLPLHSRRLFLKGLIGATVTIGATGGGSSTSGTTSTPTNAAASSQTAGTTLFTYQHHTQVVLALSWSPNGTRIASGSEDETVQVWEAATGKTLLTYRGHARGVDAVAWSPQGSDVASGSEDATAQVWLGV